MHNYHDAYGHFPPAVIVENGVERSWRVELLPFLDQAALYQAYDKTQPWDSETNRKIAETRVSAYTHPADDRDGAFTAYFAPIGNQSAPEHSLWVPRAEVGTEPFKGSGYRDVRDGLSNTLMLVEARRDVPWTKPEDVRLDPSQPVDPAQLGGFTPGGFQASFGDGSVRFFPQTLRAEVLRNLLTRAGGELIDFDTDVP